MPSTTTKHRRQYQIGWREYHFDQLKKYVEDYPLPMISGKTYSVEFDGYFVQFDIEENNLAIYRYEDREALLVCEIDTKYGDVLFMVDREHMNEALLSIFSQIGVQDMDCDIF